MKQKTNLTAYTGTFSSEIMNHVQKKPASHLISAYNQIIAEMHCAFERHSIADMSLQQALDLAKQQAIHTGKISSEEAHEIGEYIKRDINDAAEQMMETSAEFYDWLMLDIEVIERKVMDLFLSVADHTRIELEQFRDSAAIHVFSLAEQVPVYKTGEISGPGSLICENCGKVKPYLSSNRITDCVRCGHSRFIRRQQNTG